MTEKTIHEGRNVKRIREILGIKQDALAMELGLSQQAVSALEQKEALDKEMIEKIAQVLKVTPDAIKSFSEETVVNIIQNNYEGSTNNSSNYNHQCTFNPLEKMVELYEALLKSEREKIALLERMMDKK
jgi:transcriptional regulator with XRE-family HTH domain